MVKSLNIATFNVLNLVKPNHRYYGKRVYSNSDFEKKVAWQAAQIDKMKADIIGFQEVFHGSALRQVVNASEHLKDCKLYLAGGDGHSPSVAIASRFPIISTEVFEDIPVLEIENSSIPITKFSRPILKAVIQVDEHKTITVFVAHLKSKRPSFAEGVDRNSPIEQGRGSVRSLIRRSVEACGFREILVNHIQNNDNPTVVLGDLNDASLAVSTRVISGEPPRRYLSFEDKKRIWDVLFYHAKDIQARKSYHDFYYTHIYNGHYEALDHIMVSQELVDDNPKAIGMVRNVALFNDHLIDETLSEDKIPHWQSDHGQVVAHIEFRQ